MAVIDAVAAPSPPDLIVAEATATLPDRASMADPRGATRRTRAPMSGRPGRDLDAAFRCFHGGRILAALP
ncbi:hypothetical protein ACQEU5_24510 [Marinactinospora thermotolerans]|uniref:Uncharacterized protein n=1 Tax=Marinactinospora thermotolerans DSM 45154 TaxID=1122192 RepID=A0A1T4KGK5_9ACTN|nr:hypothetical protein [Marinactinospora thermotolerans]SJZ41544.1 hypothetical protein SAMN02745673_00368 [Marinactinospora thermotolerans DSM 45154]